MKKEDTRVQGQDGSQETATFSFTSQKLHVIALRKHIVFVLSKAVVTLRFTFSTVQLSGNNGYSSQTFSVYSLNLLLSDR